jgi:hypothetical protein
VWLAAGNYTIGFVQLGVAGDNAKVNFTLTGFVRRDPIGVDPTDPTLTSTTVPASGASLLSGPCYITTTLDPSQFPSPLQLIDPSGSVFSL